MRKSSRLEERVRSRLVLVLLLFFSLHAISAESPQRNHVTPSEDEDKIVAEWQTTRRSEADETTAQLILAEERTRRDDPLHHFTRYHGGWNISDHHYWASVGYTAVPFFVIALIWFVLFGLSLILICCCYCCCRRQSYGYSRLAYALSLTLLVFFTVAAIVGCVVLYIGQGKFHGSTTGTLNYVVRQADMTVESLKNVSGYLAAAKHIGVNSMVLSTDMQPKIDEIQNKINSSETVLSTKTHDNARKIRDGLDSMRLALVIVAAVMLFLTFLGFLVSLFGFRGLVYTLVIVGWILVAGTFILCGVFLLLHNVVADTCVAMDEWAKNPTAHTALDDILPCVDNVTAQETLLRTRDVTHQLVAVVDGVINNTTNRDLPRNEMPLRYNQSGMLFYNQSGPLVPVLCNPYNSDLTVRQCQPGEVELRNAPEVWRSYVCEVSAAGICATTGRLTPTIYEQMHALVNVSFGLYQFGPFLVQLQDCTFVRETFTGVEQSYCPGLRRHSRWIYIGLVLVSAAVMLSLVFWIIYARERRHRAYTKNYDAKAVVADPDKAG